MSFYRTANLGDHDMVVFFTDAGCRIDFGVWDPEGTDDNVMTAGPLSARQLSKLAEIFGEASRLAADHGVEVEYHGSMVAEHGRYWARPYGPSGQLCLFTTATGDSPHLVNVSPSSVTEVQE